MSLAARVTLVASIASIAGGIWLAIAAVSVQTITETFGLLPSYSSYLQYNMGFVLTAILLSLLGGWGLYYTGRWTGGPRTPSLAWFFSTRGSLWESVALGSMGVVCLLGGLAISVGAVNFSPILGPPAAVTVVVSPYLVTVALAVSAVGAFLMYWAGTLSTRSVVTQRSPRRAETHA